MSQPTPTKPLAHIEPPDTKPVPRCNGQQGFSRCFYVKGHPGPCSFQEADYLGGYSP